MDGFNVSDNILVFAATNLVKKLDPALTRSEGLIKKFILTPILKKDVICLNFFLQIPHYQKNYLLKFYQKEVMD